MAYAEIVASIASRSAGPGTRANIDEFTETTAAALESVGGAQQGKAIIILNPVEPPMIMRDTVFCAIPADADPDAISASIATPWSTRCSSTCPATRCAPSRSTTRRRRLGRQRPGSAVFLEVRGNGDYLPSTPGTSTS